LERSPLEGAVQVTAPFDRAEAERLISRAEIALASDGSVDIDSLLDLLRAALVEIDRLEGYRREFEDAAALLNARRVPLASGGRHLTLAERIAIGGREQPRRYR